MAAVSSRSLVPRPPHRIATCTRPASIGDKGTLLLRDGASVAELDVSCLAREATVHPPTQQVTTTRPPAADSEPADALEPRAAKPPGPDLAGDHIVELVPEAAPTGVVTNLRGAAVNGVVITAVFAVMLEGVRAVGGLLTAHLLQPSDFALFGIVAVALLFASTALNFDLGSRLVQMKGEPGEVYDQAFSFQLWLSAAYVLFALAAGPVLVMLYHDNRLVLICIALSLQAVTLPSSILLVYLQRELAWWRQRIIGSVGPIVGMVITIGLAIGGFGLWSLVLGQLANVFVTALMMWRWAPRRPHLVLHIPRESLRFLLSFGWPLWLVGLITVASINAMVLEVQLILGLIALGYFRVAVGLGDRIDTAENVVSSVIFPVICRLDGHIHMQRAYEISARVVLVWAVPTGLGLAVFSNDIARFVLGPTWGPIVPLLQLEGVAEVVNAIGTMWGVFYMATGNNRPSLWAGLLVNVVLVVLIAVLGHLFGLPGIAGAIGIASVAALVQRRRFIRRLFPGVGVVMTAVPLVTAGAIATLAAILVHRVEPDPNLRSLGIRVVAFIGVYLLLASLLERHLVREAYAIFRPRTPGAAS